MSTHHNIFLWRNKKNMSFLIAKSASFGAKIKHLYLFGRLFIALFAHDTSSYTESCILNFFDLT